MKPLTAMLLAACALATGCGIGGTCPSADELTQEPLASGTYVGAEVTDYGIQSPYIGGTDHTLVIDREAGTATLSFTTTDGKQVEIALNSIDDGWQTF